MYKRYERYKDSGVEWIGEVPEHWDYAKLKQRAILVYGDSLPTEERTNGSIPVYGSGGIIGYHYKANTSCPVIVIGRKGSYGSVFYSEQPVFVIDTAYYIDTYKCESDLKWLYYLLLLLELNKMSQDTGVPGLSRNYAHEKLIPNLPLNEQYSISSYLNHITSEIDSLIADKEKLIKKLEEYKQSLITEAVTKGLNPNVNMKDSGIDWIGEIPEHWEIKKLKHVVRLIKVKTGNENLPYIGLEHIESWTGKYMQPDNTPQPEAESNLFEAEDVLFGKLRPYLAKAFMPTFNGRCSSEFLVLRRKLIQRGFLFYSVLSHHFINKVNSSTYGAKMPRASWNYISELPQPIPFESEQEEIYKLLDSKINTIDNIIEENKDLIHKIKSYRQSLIYEAVTGKIDVRDYEPERSEQLA